MSELYIPPERFERDFITGRFLKGCVSRNKGRKMVYHSKRSKARSIKNLSKGRGAWHKTGAGMNKKSVVLIKDEKLCGVFPSIQMAGKMIGVAPSLISAMYVEPYSRSIIKITESKELIDAAYEMLCWCIENGYAKVGKEE